MKLPRFIILVAFLFIGLASATTASGNEGVEVDKGEEAAAKAKAEQEDELSDLWRRFLLNECWRKEPTPAQMGFEFRRAGDILRPEDMDYGPVEDVKVWEGYKEHSRIPPETRIWGNAWDCDCGGLRQWIWDYWPPSSGWPTFRFKEDAGALNASFWVEDDHFRAAVADPAVDWAGDVARDWHVFYKFRKLRRGYFTIPMLQTEYCQYPRFNDTEV